MSRNWARWTALGTGLLAGAAGAAFWRWEHRRLADLAAGSELVETDRGVIEVARRGSGAPVLVVHGTPGGYDQGLLLGEDWFGDDVEIIAPSRPGYLRTPLGDNRSPSAQAALFVALLDELDVEQAVVVGVSGGGPSALHLAAEYPDRVSGLILRSAATTEIDAHELTTGNPIVDPVITSAPALALRSGLFVLLQRFAPDSLVTLPSRMSSTLDGEDLEEYVAFVEGTPGHRERILEAVSVALPASARVDGTLNDERWFRRLPLVDYGTIECPVLVLHGEFDAGVPIAHAEFVAERIPDADLVRLEADHFIMVSPDAERAERTVQTFVDQLRPSTEPTSR